MIMMSIIVVQKSNLADGQWSCKKHEGRFDSCRRNLVDGGEIRSNWEEAILISGRETTYSKRPGKQLNSVEYYFFSTEEKKIMSSKW